MPSVLHAGTWAMALAYIPKKVLWYCESVPFKYLQARVTHQEEDGGGGAGGGWVGCEVYVACGRVYVTGCM